MREFLTSINVAIEWWINITRETRDAVLSVSIGSPTLYFRKGWIPRNFNPSKILFLTSFSWSSFFASSRGNVISITRCGNFLRINMKSLPGGAHLPKRLRKSSKVELRRWVLRILLGQEFSSSKDSMKMISQALQSELFRFNSLRSKS